MKLNVDLDNLYQTWQGQITNRDVDFENFLLAFDYAIFKTNIEEHRRKLEMVKLKTTDEKVKQELKLLIEEVDKFYVQLNENYQIYVDFVHNFYDELRGLTTRRIQQFEQFTADESFIGDQCVICMGDFEIGSNMMRLDSDGQHTFCQVCIERWFANHKTCPICRHAF